MSFYTDFPLYPTEVFDDTDYPTQVDNTDTVYAALVNALKEELQAVMTELGVLPKGAAASVKARLDAQRKKIQDADGDTSWDTEETADKDEIQGKVAGVEFFRGHSDGIVTLAKQSGCRVYLSSAGQTIPSFVETKIEFDGEAYDTQNEFDSTTNYRWTAKKAGIYLFTASLMYLSPVANKRLNVMVKLNGVDAAQASHHSSNTGQISVMVTEIRNIAVNDYIEINTLHNCGGNENIHNHTTYTYFSIHKLS